MKNKAVYSALVLSVCLLLGGCTGTSAVKKDSTASAQAAGTAAGTEESFSDVEYMEGDDAYYDDMEEYEEPVSEKLVGTSLENPYGEAAEVSVWEDIEVVPDTDGKTYSNLTSYANQISISHAVMKADGDAKAALLAAVKEETTFNMGYPVVRSESPRLKDDRAWVMLSYEGKGYVPSAEIVAVKKLTDGVFVKSTASWYIGTDMYGMDYTPAEKYLNLIRDEWGVSPAEGEEISLSKEDLEPEIELHAHEFKDSRVGTKSFMVWEKDPYVTTADEELAEYEDEELVWSEVESWEEDPDVEDGELVFEEEETAPAEVIESGAEAVVSGAEFAQSGVESVAEDMWEDEGESNYVAYCSTSAQGAFVNAEMAVKSGKETAQSQLETYLEDLKYMGANELKRSEIETSGDSAWVTIRYGSNEEQDAYKDLTQVHAVIGDADTWTTLDIFIPSDAVAARYEEYLKAYGITAGEATITVEQEPMDDFDYGFESVVELPLEDVESGVTFEEGEAALADGEETVAG